MIGSSNEKTKKQTNTQTKTPPTHKQTNIQTRELTHAQKTRPTKKQIKKTKKIDE